MNGGGAPLLVKAAETARTHSLGAYDAVHLAGGLSFAAGEELKFACWDKELRDAAKKHGFALIPPRRCGALWVGGAPRDREIDRCVHYLGGGRAIVIGGHCLSHPSTISRYPPRSRRSPRAFLPQAYRHGRPLRAPCPRCAYTGASRCGHARRHRRGSSPFLSRLPTSASERHSAHTGTTLRPRTRPNSRTLAVATSMP